MTIYDMLKDAPKEKMVGFLFSFTKDVLENFSHGIFPTKEGIEKLLDTEIPGNNTPEEKE